MNHLLILFIALPFLGFFINLLLPKRKEGLISTAALVTVAAQGVFGSLFLLYWFFDGAPQLASTSWKYIAAKNMFSILSFCGTTSRPFISLSASRSRCW